jgi:hypothetical protein
MEDSSMRGRHLVALALSLVLMSQTRPTFAQTPITPFGAVPPPGPVTDLFPAAPPVESAGESLLPNLRFTAELLVLHPNRDGLGNAVVSDGMGFRTAEFLNWDAVPGFRIGGYYRLPNSDLEFGTTFTYFHATTHDLASAPAGGSLRGVLAEDDNAHSAQNAEGAAGLTYSLLDFDVSRSTAINDCLWFRAFGGVRVANINQTLKSIYTGGSLGSDADYVSTPIRFEGAGLTAGAEANWNLFHGWGIYGRGRLGLISGEFNSRRTEIAGASLIVDESDRYFTVIPVAELGAGVSYQCEGFFFSVGYEVTDWFNMVSGIGNLTSHRRGDLTLDALTIKVGFSF